MDGLDVYMVAFNCARTLIDLDYFALRLFAHSRHLQSPPDLIVLCLQEVAPIAHAFLGGSLLVPYFRRFIEAVNRAASADFDTVAVRNIGLTAIIVLIKRDKSPKIHLVSRAEAGVGQWGMGNKGAIGVRLAVDSHPQAQLTFVSAHLAAMEAEVLRRNQDWRDIVANLIFTDVPNIRSIPPESDEAEPLLQPQGSASSLKPEAVLFEPRIPVFFAGDLNYRTGDAAPTADAHKGFPQPSPLAGSTSSESWFRMWRERDQLTRERLNGSTMNGLEELPVAFPPTYKYRPDSSITWPEDGFEPAMYIWAKHRYPSWCDRILFSRWLTQQKASTFDAGAYTALPLQPTSDHRPVALSFRLDLRSSIDDDDTAATEEPVVQKNPQWAASRARARRLELIVGSIAYLTLTVEGNITLLGSLLGAGGAYFILRSMIEI
ncbi:MAG: hypothetical protein Q9159_007341 [Coniocarpon cinnabarinum]